MAIVYSKALDKGIEVGRIIGHIKGEQEGPTVIMLGGIHGNEPSGVFALHSLCRKLQEDRTPIKGEFYAISGNLQALEEGVRFEKEDLNRMWSTNRIQYIFEQEDEELETEEQELKELYLLLREIAEKSNGPVYCFDLHTTSSKSIPFLIINDTLLNRKFCQQFPLPVILGIEEYLKGPVLSHVNEWGYIALGFESGQHDALEAIENHYAFAVLTMIYTGMLRKNDFAGAIEAYRRLKTAAEGQDHMFEIIYRYELKDSEGFLMQPGYANFQAVSKGESLAMNNIKRIYSPHGGFMFMPLYQNQGNDGFYIIRRIKQWAIWMSRVLRKIKFDHVLSWLPGISWGDEEKHELRVDLRIARFMAKDIFHLLGYLSKQADATHLVLKKRESFSRNELYENAPWVR